MWNSEAPMRLLNEMPQQLNSANLQRIQQIIDIDKYSNSFDLGRDLCGEYAPFCLNCDKNIEHPCAVAYVKMKQAEGVQVEIAVSDAVAAEELTAESTEPKDAKRIRIAIAKRKH